MLNDLVQSYLAKGGQVQQLKPGYAWGFHPGRPVPGKRRK